MPTTCDVEEFVNVGLEEIIGMDLEGFLDHIAELSGHPLLMDISYEVVSLNEDKTLRIKVTGCIEVEEEEDGEEHPPAP